MVLVSIFIIRWDNSWWVKAGSSYPVSVSAKSNPNELIWWNFPNQIRHLECDRETHNCLNVSHDSLALCGEYLIVLQNKYFQEKQERTKQASIAWAYEYRTKFDVEGGNDVCFQKCIIQVPTGSELVQETTSAWPHLWVDCPEKCSQSSFKICGVLLRRISNLFDQEVSQRPVYI